MHVPVIRFGGFATTSGRAKPHHGIRIAPRCVFSRESAATIRRRHPHHLRLLQQPWQAPAIGSLYSSSLAEPALFTAISTAEAIAATAADVVVPGGGGVGDDHLLWSDVRTMGAILGEFISVQDGDKVLVKVETMRKMAR